LTNGPARKYGDM